MPQSYWLVFAGIGFGLVLAHLVDVAAAWVHKNLWGEKSISPHFSPKGGCTTVVVNELNQAHSEILVQAYSFTCKDIAQALIAAAGRGVKVSVLLDKSNEAESYSELGDLSQHNVDVRIDACHAIAHNKVMIIDGTTVLTGSFNFTRQAEIENAENLLVLKNHSDLAAIYRTNFRNHQEHCHRPGEVELHPGAGARSATASAGHAPAGPHTDHTRGVRKAA